MATGHLSFSVSPVNASGPVVQVLDGYTLFFSFIRMLFFRPRLNIPIFLLNILIFLSPFTERNNFIYENILKLFLITNYSLWHFHFTFVLGFQLPECSVSRSVASAVYGKE